MLDLAAIARGRRVDPPINMFGGGARPPWVYLRNCKTSSLRQRAQGGPIERRCLTCAASAMNAFIASSVLASPTQRRPQGAPDGPYCRSGSAWNEKSKAIVSNATN